jgi:hypothetical protein
MKQDAAGGAACAPQFHRENKCVEMGCQRRSYKRLIPGEAGGHRTPRRNQCFDKGRPGWDRFPMRDPVTQELSFRTALAAS